MTARHGIRRWECVRPPDAAGGQRTATDRVLALLHQKYSITARDFLSADLQIVPATMPRDVGLDRALLGAYGQDDRVTGYISLRAIADMKAPRYTSIAYAVNNEEVNSWTTGVNSGLPRYSRSQVSAGRSVPPSSARNAPCALRQWPGK